MPGLDVFLFGKPRIERDGAAVTVARRKALALLAYLVVTRQAHSRDALIALLWPELDSEHGRAVLRSTLADLSQAIGKEALAVEGDGVAYQAPTHRVDVARFHDLLTQVAGHNDPRSQPCDDCLAALTEAVELYRADFLAGFTLDDTVEFDAWQTFQTESLRLELAAALEKLAQGLAGRGDHAAALAHARRWLALDPLHEPAHRLIMQLHAGAGDRAAAIRQYRECVKILQDELGVEPEPETTALFETIRSGAASDHPAAPLPAHSPAHNLPPGPTPFIGREPELAQVATQLADPDCRLLTILGPGGIGKTRLAVRAAQVAADRFAHGACFVDLAPIASAELLAATCAAHPPGALFRRGRAGSARVEPSGRQTDAPRPGQLRALVDRRGAGSARRLRSRHEAPGRCAPHQAAGDLAHPAERAGGVVGAAGGDADTGGG